MFSPELKKGSIEMLILSLVEARPRHGYEIGKLIERRSGGRLTFALPTLYPTLLRLENRGWIKGRWVERAGERERCFYRLTPEGRRVLAEQRATWRAYVAAVNEVHGAAMRDWHAYVRAHLRLDGLTPEREVADRPRARGAARGLLPRGPDRGRQPGRRGRARGGANHGLAPPGRRRPRRRSRARARRGRCGSPSGSKPGLPMGTAGTAAGSARRTGFMLAHLIARRPVTPSGNWSRRRASRGRRPHAGARHRRDDAPSSASSTACCCGRCRIPEPDALVRVHEIVPQYGRFSVAPATFLDWRQQNTVFERIAAYRARAGRSPTADGPERIQGAARVVGRCSSCCAWRPRSERASRRIRTSRRRTT